MKKFLFAIFTLFIVNSAIAQDVKLGLKAGTNFSTFAGSGDFSIMSWILPGDLVKMRLGFNIGGFLEYSFNKRFSLQPEILYSTQGAGLDWNLASALFISGYYSLNYINIPILLKVNIAEGLSAQIGPQIGFLISSYRTIKIGEWKTNADNERYYKETVLASGRINSKSNTIDFTANIGLSYTFEENFVVGARYGLGLTKTSKNPANKWKNSVIQLSIGYKFNSSK